MALLSGIKVLDFGRFIAGPYCATLLADHGADVIRIERIEGGEDRYVPPVADTGEGGLYMQVNRNKRCLTLDLASDAGRDIVRRLVKSADVVVANLPPATLKQLGLDYATLSALNPRIVLATVTAFGPGGPYSQRPGFDGVGQAMSGAMYMSGLPDAPMRAAATYVDFSTAQACAMGVLAALWSREKTGVGQLVEGSLLRTALILNNPVLIEQAVRAPNRIPQGNRGYASAPADVFKTRTGWVMVQAIGPSMFERWCDLIGASELKSAFGVPRQLDGRATSAIDLTLAGLSSSLVLKGKLGLDTLAFNGFDGTVALRTPALADLSPLVSMTLPALMDLGLDSGLALPANLQSVSLKGAKLRTRDGDMSGDVTLGPGMAVTGKLRADRLDLDALGVILPGATAGTAGPMISNTPLPWSALRGSTIDLTGSFGAVTFLQQSWPNVNMVLQLKAGRLRVELPGAPFGASLTADAANDSVPVGLVVHAPAIPFAFIARQAGLPGPASGAVQMDAELRGTGRSLHDLAASLNGQLAVTMNTGSISNAALLSLASPALKALGIEVPPQGETAINCFGVIGVFSNGIGHLRTLALDTPYLEMSGTGQVDMGAETVALRIRPQAHMSGSSITVPVVIDGPFGALQSRLDASFFDQLGLLFASWGGGSSPDTCVDAGLKK